MKKFLAAATFAVALSLTGLVSTPASAAPPTATVSPGYDARLAASQSTDISARRYYRRYGYYRPYYRPYYAPRPYYYGGYGYYRRPGIYFGF
jgi:hypothetical protein